MAGYQVLNDQTWQFGDYAIHSVRVDDSESIRKWRNEQMSALRQSRTLTIEEQNCYFRDSVITEFSSPNPRKILVRFTLKGLLIGYGGIVHIHWPDQRGEISFLLETSRANNSEIYVRELNVFLSLITKLAFNHLGLNKLSTESYNHRLNHVRAIEDFGFTREGILRKHTLINGKWVDSVVASLLKDDFRDKLL